MKVAFVGGHLAPALAIIKKLLDTTDIVFIGRKYGFEGDKAITLEYRVIQQMGIPFYSLTAGRLQRSLTRNTIPSLIKLPFGFIQAMQYLRKTRPDVVVAFGGYLSLPVAYAAWMLRIPIIIHEQTLGLGLANKLIAPLATKVCISWESSKEYLKTDNVILTGNPVREDIIHPIPPDFAPEIPRELPCVYITGGSAGSHAINALVGGCLEKLLEHTVVVHQTGDAKEFRDYDLLQEKRNALPDKLQKRYILRKFIDPQHVGYLMKHATLVVGRSGINTVSELLYLKKPALLIPLPFSQAQEQLQNARMLQDIGLAEIVDQDTATVETLYDKISAMITHQNMYTIKQDEKTYNSLKAATENIIEVIKVVAEKNNR